MKATFAIALIAIFVSSAAAFDSCLAFSGFNAFNLCPFSKDYVNFTITASNLDQITFSVSGNHISSCDASGKVYAIDNTVDNKCYNISQKSPEFSLINSSNSTEGLVITYPSVNISENPAYNTTRQLVVVLKCNMSATSINGTQFGNAVATSPNTTTTIFTVTGESRYACPGSADFLIDFVKENKNVFATILIVLGSLFNFFGFKLVKFTIFAIATVVGFTGSGMFLYSQVSITTSKPVFWVLALFCLVLGLALGYAAHKLRQVAIFFVGAALGLVGGYILYTGILHSMLGSSANSNTYLYITQGVCALIGGILAFVLNEIVFIVSTSVVGSYMIASAIALFTGQFHEEDVTNGDFEFGQYKYFYLAGIVILAGCGIYYQHVSKAKNQEEIEQKDNNVPKYGYAYYRY